MDRSLQGRSIVRKGDFADPSKRTMDRNMQPSPQNKDCAVHKGAQYARVTLMLCVTDIKLGLIPCSLCKGLQL